MASLDVNGLFRRYRDELMRFLCRRVPSRDDAADLMQESFLRLMRAAPAAAEVQDAGAYLFATAARLALDHHRHRRVARPAEDDGVLVSLPDPTPTPEAVAADREALARAMAAMATLPERTRIAFEMHRLGGRTQTEIARELGVSVTLVWRMIHDAYAVLRQALDDPPDGRP